MREGINIIAIANGWLVHLPYMPQAPMQQVEEFWNEDRIRDMVRIQQDELNSDPLLKKLQTKEEKVIDFDRPLPKPNVVIADRIKDTHTHYFATIPEVVEFLSKTVIDFKK